MANIRAAFILVLFVIMTVALMPLQFLAVKFHARAAKAIPHFYHRMFCRLMGMRITVIGGKMLGGALVTANHTGWLDIPILSAVMPASFVSKSEVARWPFFGTLARLQRTVFTHRKRADILADRETIKGRLIAGDALVIFPEGTSSDGNRVLPFRSALLSAAELEIGANGASARHAIVQPISIAYTRLHGVPMGRENRPFFAWYGDMELVPHLWESFRTGPIDVVVELHKPLTIDEAGGRKELAVAAEKAVRAGLVRALAGTHLAAQLPHQDVDLMEALTHANSEEAA
ncbi:MAG: 1-acyl-sn-glycerol-3-phosphate acyltransferase [Alphaproteobacteria bacterium]|nr:1-acyl-sn-glycerol-3-phosphate acyltransferase [Alphaproteobacteria bacterium]